LLKIKHTVNQQFTPVTKSYGHGDDVIFRCSVISFAEKYGMQVVAYSRFLAF